MNNINRGSAWGVQALTEERIKAIAPSIFADHAQEDVSNIYQFLPTSSILNGMRDQGWVPVEAQEQRVSGPSKEIRRGYQKHMLRFARVKDLERFANKLEAGRHELDYAKPLATRTDIMIVNSHNRTSGYQLYGAPFRLVCYNGLVISDASMQHLSIRHVGFDPDKVVQASLGMAETIPMINDVMAGFQDRILTDAERTELAERALDLRWERGTAPIGAGLLLEPRRYEDGGNDLWRVFNVIQENLTKGGIRDRELRSAARREHKRAPAAPRAIVGIDQNITVNQALWDLALEFNERS